MPTAKSSRNGAFDGLGVAALVWRNATRGASRDEDSPQPSPTRNCPNAGTLLRARMAPRRVTDSDRRMPGGDLPLQRATTKPLVIRPSFVSMTMM